MSNKHNDRLAKWENPKNHSLTRRRFLASTTAGVATASILPSGLAKRGFKLNYILSSSMYGNLPLSTILPEVGKTGADIIDIWPRVHGNQREQMEKMGHKSFAAMLKKHNTQLGCITRYDLGPFKLQSEMKVCSKLGGDLLICAGGGPRGLTGNELKNAVKSFAEKIKPHTEAAETTGVKLGIENHSSNLINTPDSLKWLIEFCPSKNIGIAIAPYHLETLGQSANDLAKLVGQLGDRVFMFYAWQHGMGCMKKLPKEQELLQMPGRGKLDFTPILRSLKAIDYTGYTAIFMHPVPRGFPILPTAAETTKEINRARKYLEMSLTKA